MEKQYECVEDYQGTDFAIGRMLTAKEWGEQARDWADNWDDQDQCLLENFENEQALIDYIQDMWEIKIVERNPRLMTLTNEQKINFFHAYNNGDIWGMNYLEVLIDAYDGENAEELQELVRHVTNLNAMEIICESEHWKTYQRNSTAINDLYINMKNELFEALGISEEDFEFWGC